MSEQTNYQMNKQTNKQATDAPRMHQGTNHRINNLITSK